MNQKVKKRNVDLRSVFLMLMFPLTVVYYEIVFRLTTVGGLFNSGTFSMLLFSLSLGLVGYLLLSFFKKGKARFVTALILFVLGALPYIIQNFVYRQFKVYYDLNTIFYGAEDMMGDYTADVFRMIFSPSGIFTIIIFFLPAILFCEFGSKWTGNGLINFFRRVASAILALLLWLLALLFIWINPAAKAIYKTEYNYQSAVGHFGLFTGVRLDVWYMISDSDSGGFEIQGGESVPSIPSIPSGETEKGEENKTEEVIEYGYNQMTLDLSATGGSIGELNAYVSALTPSKQNRYTGLFKGKNLILITAEAFTAEVIDPVLTPTLYRLANKGIQFKDYYQPASAGTTGGEYQNVFGMLPTAGGASFKNTADHYNYMTMGSQLNRLGYYGKAFHNNSYTYYSRNLTHNNLGYSDGFMGYGNGMEAYVKNAWPQSDLEMFQGTLPTYIDKAPFSVYYMTVSGHSGYSTTGNSMTKRNWSSVTHLPYSDQVKGYFAANLELEKAMAYLVSTLEEKGIADDTVICISTDHFPYGLDANGRLGDMPYLSELYGTPVNDYFQRDHSALILWSGCLEEMDPIVVKEPTFSLDILPTLSNLFGTEFDSRLFPGRDVFSDAEALVFNTNYDWKTAYGTYYNSKGEFVPANDSIRIPEGYVESVKAVVRNKMRYCRLALDNDYFRHLFAK